MILYYNNLKRSIAPLPYLSLLKHKNNVKIINNTYFIKQFFPIHSKYKWQCNSVPQKLMWVY